jgi:hypothetical protein
MECAAPAVVNYHYCDWLSDCGVHALAAIHITDLDPHSLAAGGGLEDVSLVKKYEISEEDYMKRENNFRHWKASKQSADPNWCRPAHASTIVPFPNSRSSNASPCAVQVFPEGDRAGSGATEDEARPELCPRAAKGARHG